MAFYDSKDVKKQAQVANPYAGTWLDMPELANKLVAEADTMALGTALNEGAAAEEKRKKAATGRASTFLTGAGAGGMSGAAMGMSGGSSARKTLFGL